MVFEKTRRRGRSKEKRLAEEIGDEENEEDWGTEIREWMEGQPWASVGGRTGSARVRRVRRDIRYKGQQSNAGSGG